ncbi:MAG: hypothetical protein GY885_16640 [Phycisphaeraceae bacterium]|nr:hypothetical protein [Phycisphaeraceae bacterium]
MSSIRASHHRRTRHPRRRLRWMSLLATMPLWIATVPALADGGVVVWTGLRLDRPSAVIVSPPAPRIGGMEIAWVGVRHPEASVTARHVDGVEVLAGFEPGLLADEHRALLDLAIPGAWSMRLDPDGEGPAAAVVFDVVVGDAVPPWRTMWPAIFAWVPLAAIGLAAAWRRTSVR